MREQLKARLKKFSFKEGDILAIIGKKSHEIARGIMDVRRHLNAPRIVLVPLDNRHTLKYKSARELKQILRRQERILRKEAT